MKAIATAFANSTLGFSIRQLPPRARWRLLVAVLVLAVLACVLGVLSVPPTASYDDRPAASVQAYAAPAETPALPAR